MRCSIRYAAQSNFSLPAFTLLSLLLSSYVVVLRVVLQAASEELLTNIIRAEMIVYPVRARAAQPFHPLTFSHFAFVCCYVLCGWCGAALPIACAL